LIPVFDDVVNLTVADILRGIGVQIGDAGVDDRADGGSPSRIETVTGSAASEEVFAALLDGGPIAGVWVLQAALLRWNREVPYGSGRERFKSRWCRSGAESAPLEHACAECAHEQQRESCGDQYFSNLHNYNPRLFMTSLAGCIILSKGCPSIFSSGK
jgi:hypothetical protein